MRGRNMECQHKGSTTAAARRPSTDCSRFAWRRSTRRKWTCWLRADVGEVIDELGSVFRLDPGLPACLLGRQPPAGARRRYFTTGGTAWRTTSTCSGYRHSLSVELIRKLQENFRDNRRKPLRKLPRRIDDCIKLFCLKLPGRCNSLAVWAPIKQWKFKILNYLNISC